MSDAEFEAVTEANLSQFCYQRYRYFTNPSEVTIHRHPDQPNTFVYQYDSFLTTYGHKGTVELILADLTKNLDPATRYEVTFQNHHLPSIQKYFGDFDLIDEAGDEREGINQLLTMQLDKASFTPRRQLKTGKRIEGEMLGHFDPDLEEYAQTGVVYGIIEDAELISAAPVPFIRKEGKDSFAILHGVYTNERYRQKGYATGSVRAALNFLFTRKIIRSVFVWVDEENPGVEMYRKIGFESAGMWLGTNCFLR